MIEELLSQNRDGIVDKWIQSITTTYPSETSHFLQLKNDPFENPVGHIISDTAAKIFDEITKGFDPEKVKSSLSDIIKVRAVQDFSPSQALEFIFSLKETIRAELECEIKNEDLAEELTVIESRIDRTALAAFDLYMEAREKVYQLRIKEIKTNTSWLLNTLSNKESMK